MVAMLTGKRVAILAAVIAYTRLKRSKAAHRVEPRSVSGWRLARVLDVADPASSEVVW